MSTYRGTCVECGQPVSGRCARQLLCAWEVERPGGGANRVAGPGKAYTHRIMHLHCQETAARREAHGLVGQEAML